MADNPTVLIVTRRGRPRTSSEALVPVTSWVPASTYDRLVKHADRTNLSVSRLVCRLITLRASAEFPTDK